jgi:hypothetical protein
MLCEFPFANDMIITSTQFQYQQIYKATWISPDETTLTQIDHSVVNANKKELSQNI